MSGSCCSDSKVIGLIPQALLAVLLLQHRRGHLRGGQQRPGQDGHLKVGAGGHARGEGTPSASKSMESLTGIALQC